MNGMRTPVPEFRHFLGFSAGLKGLIQTFELRRLSG